MSYTKYHFSKEESKIVFHLDFGIFSIKYETNARPKQTWVKQIIFYIKKKNLHYSL